MTLLPWKKYIEYNIGKFREYYDLLTAKEKKAIMESKKARGFSLNKPCQVIIIAPSPNIGIFLLVLHALEFPDMDIAVYEGKPIEELRKELSTMKKGWMKFLPNIEISFVLDYLDYLERTTELDKRTWTLWGGKNSFYILSTYDFRSDSDFLFDISRETVVRESDLEKRKVQIEETVDNLRKNVEAIPEEVDLRNKIIETTEKLENQMKELHEKLEAEVGGVRQLIGTSEKFLDWKAFTTDIEHLKTTHVAKEIFDSEIKRIDEKIDKGLEALDTRIEDLKAIKFWSKRTVLEIALAVWGAIVTLYATGIIKF